MAAKRAEPSGYDLPAWWWRELEDQGDFSVLRAFLTDKEREVVVLRHLGYSIRDIARRLKLAPGSVQGRLQSAWTKWVANGESALRKDGV